MPLFNFETTQLQTFGQNSQKYSYFYIITAGNIFLRQLLDVRPLGKTPGCKTPGCETPGCKTPECKRRKSKTYACKILGGKKCKTPRRKPLG